MAKSILIIFILFFTVGCGEKQIEVTPKVEEVESNATNITSDVTTIEEVKNVVSTEEFVPAHIANSTIEVVPH
jgi:uncharacterized protein YcfL